jgi:two-component system, NarL family, response regulator DevR
LKPKIRVLIVDDHAVVSRGIGRLLAQYPDFEVVGEAATVEAALEEIRSKDPDVALVDIRLGRSDAPSGIDLVRRLKRKGPRPRVAVLTAYDEDRFVFEALRAGVDAYILKTVSEDVLADAIRAIHAGQRFVSGAVLGRVLSEFQDLSRQREQRDLGLSDEDVRVLRLLANGATTAQISTDLFCSEPTLKRRLHAIFEKLAVPGRTQAVADAIRRGII